jgi:hypothetical protein
MSRKKRRTTEQLREDVLRRDGNPIINVPELDIHKRESELTPEEQAKLGAILFAEEALEALVREGEVVKVWDGEQWGYRLRVPKDGPPPGQD